MANSDWTKIDRTLVYENVLIGSVCPKILGLYILIGIMRKNSAYSSLQIQHAWHLSPRFPNLPVKTFSFQCQEIYTIIL